MRAPQMLKLLGLPMAWAPGGERASLSGHRFPPGDLCHTAWRSAFCSLSSMCRILHVQPLLIIQSADRVMHFADLLRDQHFIATSHYRSCTTMQMKHSSIQAFVFTGPLSGRFKADPGLGADVRLIPAL